MLPSAAAARVRSTLAASALAAALGVALLPACGASAPPAGTDAGLGACVLPTDAGEAWSDPGAAAPVPDPRLAGQVHHFYKISVVDAVSGLPVKAARLTTTNDTVYTTDRNGVVAYYEPGLMDTDVYFTPQRVGYSRAADGFGYTGVALHTSEGGEGTITMTRSSNIEPPDPGDRETRLLAGPVPGAAECFALRFVDPTSSRGVPLVALATDDDALFVSDSQGMIAYCDPDRVGTEVHFTVTSHGYHLNDGPDLVVSTSAGGALELGIFRDNVAERLYRTTGQGIYRDSVLLGLTTPLAAPNLNGLVMGQDTPFTNVYDGKLYWVWGDTDRPAYPLGNFRTSGAVSALPGAGGLSPDLGVDTTYFVDDSGFSRGMIDTTETGGPLWLGQLVNVADAAGQPRMYGRFMVARPMSPTTALAVFDDATATFDFVADDPAGATLPAGRPVVIDSGAGPFAYWSNPVRFAATVAGVTAVAAYEVYSAYGAHGSTVFERHADGSLAYDWKPGALPVSADAVVAAGLPRDQALDDHLVDVLDGGAVQIAASSMIWNDYRQRFSKIIQQKFGASSLLGEIWYAEADTPLGPWVFARKIVSHDDYTFYNPDLIPYFSEAGGRILFFDATYTATYTDAKPTPRYDYNEIMYRLDLDVPQVGLPVPIYERGGGDLVDKRGLHEGDAAAAPAFFAYDRPLGDAVPVAWSGPACAARRLVAGATPASAPVFYALPADASPGAQGVPTVPLYEYDARVGDGHVYSVDPALALAGYLRGKVVAQVWPSPIRVALPVTDFLGDLVADAGPDQCLTAASAGGASVTLDGSASRDRLGPITRYSWQVAGCEVATGATATLVLPAGVFDVLLETRDAAGRVATDHVIIGVSPAR
jgi:hypothetical protein